MKKIGIIILTVVIALVTITSISASKPHPKKMIMINNGEDYTSLWKEVEKFDAKRLPKSALEQVNKIYTQAKADNNQEQIIKTLFYKAKYQQSLEEHSFIKAMAVFKMEAEKAAPTSRGAAIHLRDSSPALRPHSRHCTALTLSPLKPSAAPVTTPWKAACLFIIRDDLAIQI